MNYHKGQRKVVITEDDNINHVNSLYDEMRHMRTQLLNRIELLEDDVSRLSQDSMEYDMKLILQSPGPLESQILRVEWEWSASPPGPATQG